MIRNMLIGPSAVAHACNPSTLGGRGGWIMRSRDGDHSGQHGETPFLLKIQKPGMVARACSPSYSGGLGRRITWTQEAEIAVSWDLSIALQPDNRVRLRLQKKERKKERNMLIGNGQLDLFIHSATIYCVHTMCNILYLLYILNLSFKFTANS